MARWVNDNSLSTGQTPLAKIEGRNPAYSEKDRIGSALIWDAEQRGLLGSGKEIVEPTSGGAALFEGRFDAKGLAA